MFQRFTFWKHRHKWQLLHRSEIQLLIGIEVHGTLKYAVAHRRCFLRALGDYNDVSPILSFQWFAQAACRQQFVVDNQPMIVNEQYVQSWFNIPMLKGIVKHDDLHVFRCFVIHQSLDSMATIGINGYVSIWKLAVHLVRFIAYLWHRGLSTSHAIATRLSLISATEHGHLKLLAEQVNKVL